MDKNLLERYFTGGHCTPSELAAIREYLENPDQTLQDLMASAWQQAGGPVNEQRKAITLQKLLAATGQTAHVPVDATPVVTLNTRKRWLHYGAAAAIAGLLIMAGVVVYRSKDHSIAAAERPWKTVRNGSDKVESIVLAEGTRIWLNSRSAVSYPADFGAGEAREVRLSGEAYFEVAKDAAHPFTVHTDSLQTTVLGTSFTIMAWPGTDRIQVALVEGRVQVNGYRGRIQEVLKPGDLLSFTETDGQIKKTAGGVRPDMYEWKGGKIVLSNTPVIEALKELEQVYGVRMHYNAAEIGNRKLTGKFNREGIDTVLHNLLFAADLRFIKKDGMYFITHP